MMCPRDTYLTLCTIMYFYYNVYAKRVPILKAIGAAEGNGLARETITSRIGSRIVIQPYLMHSVLKMTTLASYPRLPRPSSAAKKNLGKDNPSTCSRLLYSD